MNTYPEAGMRPTLLPPSEMPSIPPPATISAVPESHGRISVDHGESDMDAVPGSQRWLEINDRQKSKKTLKWEGGYRGRVEHGVANARHLLHFCTTDTLEWDLEK